MIVYSKFSVVNSVCLSPRKSFVRSFSSEQLLHNTVDRLLFAATKMKLVLAEFRCDLLHKFRPANQELSQIVASLLTVCHNYKVSQKLLHV